MVNGNLLGDTLAPNLAFFNPEVLATVMGDVGARARAECLYDVAICFIECQVIDDTSVELCERFEINPRGCGGGA